MKMMKSAMTEMSQKAPFPAELYDLVSKLSYKPGWEFNVANIDRGQGSEGLTMIVKSVTPDSYHPQYDKPVLHYMIVPPAAYDRRSWQNWIFEQLLLIERHEVMEFFQIDGGRPMAPSHGPGNDPYIVRQLSTLEDVETNFKGERV